MYRRILGIVIACVVIRSACANDTVAKWVDQQLPSLLELYEHFHTHPELSFREDQTADRVAHELQQAGFEVTTKFGKTGVVAVLKNGVGKTLLLRTDLDALPVAEKTGLRYAATVTAKDEHGKETGVMHACGHDIHMTNLIATCRYLAKNRDQWKGTIVAIGQPAEERGTGAAAMLKDGLLEKFPKPDFALALHCDATLAAGQVGYRFGHATAYVDSIDITLTGRGGHGSAPHTTIDPVVMGAKLVLDLQTIVSREQNPMEPAVVTVGSIHAGTKHNIIGDQCVLQLTVRSQTPEAREKIVAAIRRKAKAVADSAGAVEPEVQASEGTPAMFNDAKLGERVITAFRRELGEEAVVARNPTMGGEDFSRYGLAGVPIFMFNLGTVEKMRLAGYARVNEPPPSLHSPRYYPDAEPTLKTAVRATVVGALELLSPR